MRVLSKFLKFIIRDKLLLISWVCDLFVVSRNFAPNFTIASGQFHNFSNADPSGMQGTL